MSRLYDETVNPKHRLFRGVKVTSAKLEPIPDDEVTVDEIWINAMTHVSPTDEQLVEIGRMVIDKLRESDMAPWPGFGRAVMVRVVAT